MLSSDDPREKHLTILLADLRGFSQLLSVTSAAKVVSVLERFYATMVKVISAHEGRVDKFMGDSVLAVFGVDNNREKAAIQAVTCAVRMQQELLKLNKDFVAEGLPAIYMGVAINSGKVIACEIGNHIYKEFTVIGDAVNVTARVEAHSLRGQVLMTDSTYRLVSKQVKTALPKKVHIKGLSQPISIYELISVNNELFTPRFEVRRHPRVEVRIPMAFQKISGTKILDTEYAGEILDLSYEGMKAEIPILLDPFTEIKFPFT